jgi:putative membrane protein
MIRLLIRGLILLIANAIGLLVASIVVSGVHISGLAFFVAVLIFTGVELLAEPLLTNVAERSAPPLRGGVALISTFIGLVVTDLLSDGLSMTGGAVTWILATLIVWLAALIAGLILPIFMVKKAVNNNRN